MLKSYMVIEAKMLVAGGISLEKALEAQKTHKLTIYGESNGSTCTIESSDTYRFNLERSDVDAMATSVFDHGIGRYDSLKLTSYDVAYSLPRIANLLKGSFIKLRSDLGYVGDARIEIHGRNQSEDLSDAGIIVEACSLHVNPEDDDIFKAALDLSFTNVNNGYYARLADSYKHIQHAKTQIEELRGKDASTDMVKLGKLLRKLNTQQLEYDELISSKIYAYRYVNLFGYAYHATATP
jgi:hypothetical protein